MQGGLVSTLGAMTGIAAGTGAMGPSSCGASDGERCFDWIVLHIRGRHSPCALLFSTDRSRPAVIYRADCCSLVHPGSRERASRQEAVVEFSRRDAHHRACGMRPRLRYRALGKAHPVINEGARSCVRGGRDNFNGKHREADIHHSQIKGHAGPTPGGAYCAEFEPLYKLIGLGRM